MFYAFPVHFSSFHLQSVSKTVLGNERKWNEVNEKEKKANAASDPIQNLEYIFQYKIHYIIPNSLQIKNQLHIKILFTINWTSVFPTLQLFRGGGFF